MKPVKQEDKLGCSVACLAFILGIKYKTAIKLLKNGEKRAKDTGFYCKDIVETLRNKGLNYQYKYIKPKVRVKIYKSYSIVFVKHSKKYKYGHYLVRFGGFWMDPWINFPDSNIKAGFRKRLSGKVSYVIYR